MTQELDLSVLKGLERQVVLDVLNRDQMLRKVDEERIRYVAILEYSMPLHLPVLFSSFHLFFAKVLFSDFLLDHSSD